MQKCSDLLQYKIYKSTTKLLFLHSDFIRGNETLERVHMHLVLVLGRTFAEFTF